MRGTRSAEARRAASATPPRRAAGLKRSGSHDDDNHDHDNNHNHDHDHGHTQRFDATPSPTIRQPRQKAAILQLPPRPDVPLGNNEETLLPSYTPELGRSVRRLEHNYVWDTKWLAELYTVVITNAKALHQLQEGVQVQLSTPDLLQQNVEGFRFHGGSSGNGWGASP